MHDLDRAFGAEVEGHGALASVERLEVGAEAVGADAELAAGVTVAGHFDLEHVGAHVGEHRGRVGAVLVAGKVDDSDSFEWGGHDQLLRARMPDMSKISDARGGAEWGGPGRIWRPASGRVR